MGSRSKRIRRSLPEYLDDWHRNGAPTVRRRGDCRTIVTHESHPLTRSCCNGAPPGGPPPAGAQESQGSGVKETIKEDAKTAAHAVAHSARTVGHAVADTSRKVGHEVADTSRRV